MEGNVSVRVRELLERPYFQTAEIIASETALDRPVTWIHIMEVTKVGHLLNGDELILTTGIGWQDEEEVGLAFLHQLIDIHAAGLCIELGVYTVNLSNRMIELARQADFPLILFHKEVKYVDITRDLHTFFINHHHQMIASLDLLTTQFNQILLNGKGLAPILRLLQEKTKKTIALLPIDGSPVIVPSISDELKQSKILEWQKMRNSITQKKKRTFSFRPIYLLNQTFAELMIIGDTELNKFDILALDRAATAVAQELMRTMYIKEHRHYRDNLWVKEWIDGNLKEHEIIDYIKMLGHTLTTNNLVVCVCEIDHKTLRAPEFETNFIQRMILARSLFERSNITLIPTMVHQQLILVLMNLKDQSSWKEPLKKIIAKLQKTDKNNGTNYFNGLKGIGPFIHNLMHIQQSFELACETVDIQKTIGQLENPFHSELHVYRLLSTIEKSSGLQSFIDDYLGVLIAYDKNKSTQLIKTLKTYYHYSCSKQDTAKNLYIVRQTLYHRLTKISELLGSDYTHPEKRLMLELAIYAYEYVHGNID